MIDGPWRFSNAGAMSVIPSWLSFSFIALVAVMYSLLVMGVLVAEARAGDKSRLPIYVLRICVGGFLLITGLLSLQGFFLAFDVMPPRILVFLAIAIVGVVVFVFHASVGRWLTHTPQSWLIAAQSFRLPLEIQIFYLAQTPLLPKLMTFEGRNPDILFGLTAPLLAYFVWRSERQGQTRAYRPIIIGWNVLGILLVGSVAVQGVLSAPTPIQRIFVDPPNTLMGHFPFVWLPVFLVPSALLYHFLSLRKLFVQKPES
jgi:hypothetical protein